MNVIDCYIGKKCALYHGDTIEVLRALPASSIDFSIFSPPFSSLYTYSASDRDMGNCRGDGEFFAHNRFLAERLYRVIKPGRLVAQHCMVLPTSKAKDGVIGLRDFPGELIRAYEAAGFTFHSKVTIWKDPVVAMQRTKAIGLLWKQLLKDSHLSRQGIPDELIVMRKQGKNFEPISHTKEGFPVNLWQKWASPVWDDIDPGDTLQYRSAREDDDERHIAPLQLEVIRRALRLWTNKGDIVYSAFGGIGSEPSVSIEEGRYGIAAELKASYYKQMVANCRAAEDGQKQLSIFDAPAQEPEQVAAQ